MPTTAEIEAQIANLQRQLLDAQRPPDLPLYQVGDLVRVRGDSRCGPKAPIPHGTVGTVVDVRSKADAVIVFLNCVAHSYTITFDLEDIFGRECNTWGSADGDVQPADAPYLHARRRKRARDV